MSEPDELNEETLADAVNRIRREPKPMVASPLHMLVTEPGIEFQARRLIEGDLTIKDMKRAGIYPETIALVLRRAADVILI